MASDPGGFDYIYAGMDATELATWVILTTIAGTLAHRIITGPRLWGMWTDMVIGMLGAFLFGWILQLIGLDPSQWVLKAVPSLRSGRAIGIDIFVVSLIGALLLRLLLRPFKPQK